MKKYWILPLCCLFSSLQANEPTFFEKFVVAIYNVFSSEQKRILQPTASITPGTALIPPQPVSVSLPQAPPLPPSPNFLPVVIVDNSAHSEGMYLTITGQLLDGTPCFISIDPSGLGTAMAAQETQSSQQYSVKIATLPSLSSPNTYYFYLPQILSGAMWFSNAALDFPVNPGPGIVQPSNVDLSSSNYNTKFDFFEVNFIPNPGEATNQFYGDATAVSAFSIPLHGRLSSGGSCGLSQSRKNIVHYLENLFKNAPNASSWNTLVRKDLNGNVLRIISPGLEMTSTQSEYQFNNSYFEDSSAYSYIDDIWTNPSSFYRTHNGLTLTIPGPVTYHGVVGTYPDNRITFKTESSSNEVVFADPATMTSSSYLIFSGIVPPNTSNNTSLVLSDTSPGGADGVQLCKLFEESIIAGISPTSETIDGSVNLLAYQPYYQVNPNLSPAGQASGPWFDLYSKGLHDLGTIYTYAFDEPLFPHVLLVQNPVTEGTFLSITIGNIE